MITCRELAELLIDFVSGDLPPEHCDRIRQHMTRCPPCVAYVESYQLTIKLSRQLPCKPLPPELKKRLRETFERVCRQERAQGLPPRDDQA